MDDRVLAPALTRLDQRVLYVTYDLVPLLQAGKNTIALWTGPGWARYKFFNTHPALRVQLNGQTTDGRSFSLASDTTWRTEISSSFSQNLGGYKGGETIDARRDVADWNAADFDDSHWPLAANTSMEVTLSAQMLEPTRIIETIKPKSISQIRSGTNAAFKVDLGKNFTGWLKIKFNGLASGDLATIKVSDEAGTTKAFGQLSQYIAEGKNGETFKNRFNYSCGRYVTLEGLKQKPKLSDVTGYAIATDLKRAGHFSCSKDLFNRIYEADLWTYRCNTTEGYTSDCPHRERLGYGEVAFATTWGIGLPNYHSGAFYMNLVRDWSDVQEENGRINHTAPQVNHNTYGGPL